ncbi:Mobile element protein [Serratia fonticola AU-AP2C]|nr:Mobile element protein [Serratia fonticola AU-AP2C]
MNKIRVVGIDIAKSVFQVCVWIGPLETPAVYANATQLYRGGSVTYFA